MFRFTDQNEVEFHAGAIEPGDFGSEQQLMKLADSRALTRMDLEVVWNRMAGREPFEKLKKVKKFRHRQYAVHQLWKAFQVLVPKAKKQRGTDITDLFEGKGYKLVTIKPAKAAKLQAKRTANGDFKPGTKVALILSLMRRKGGVALEELMEKLEWQRHTVRGFVSTLGSKHGIKIDSTKETRGRVYRTA